MIPIHHLRVHVASHFFRVDQVSPRGRLACMRFALKFVQYQMVPFQGTYVREASKVYAASTADRSEFRFHINSLYDFKQFLELEQLIGNLVIWEMRPTYTPADEEYLIKTNKVLRDNQEPIRTFVTQPIPSVTPELGNIGKSSFFVGAQTGFGKDQPLTAKIKIPGGWSTMGEMKVGSLVSTPNGDTSKVIGVYPQGLKDVVKITFSDCRQAECGLNHLWEVFSRLDSNESRVLSTTEIIKGIKNNENFFIRLISPNEVNFVNALTSTVDKVTTKTISGYINHTVVYANEKDAHFAVNVMRENGHYARSIDNKVWVIENNIDNPFRLKIVNIELVEKALTQCIAIDHPSHLYITDEYVVTHNTLVTNLSVATLGTRSCLFIKATFTKKWISDYREAYDLDANDIMVIQGSGALQAALTSMKEGTYDTKLTIVSISTFSNYISEYEKAGKGILDLGYDLLPEEFFEKMNAGVRVIDEVHLMFHMFFKLDLYTHVTRTITLSATLVDKDPFLTNMYRLAYPVAQRYNAPPPEKYTDCIALYYNIKNMVGIRTEEFGGRGYSQNAFEASIMKRPEMVRNYLKVLDHALGMTYDKHPMPNKKFMVFAGTIQMCTIMTEHLKKKANYTDVARYVEKDDYDEMLAAKDGVVTTIGSTGTGIDVPNLTTVIMTTCVSSLKANIQTMGRLRKIVGFNTEFVFFVCSDVPKQVEYADRKKTDILDARAKSIRIIHSGITI